MDNTDSASSTPSPGRPSARLRFGRPASRTSRTTALVAVAGLAAGGAFAAVSGIASASSGATAAAPAPVAAPSVPAPGWGGHGGFGGFGRFGALGGGAGTITAISGATLTLRTEQGTETVRTDSATKYAKEQEAISFAALRVGDAIRVSAPRPSAVTVPGTGTVTAIQIEVVRPGLSGRVTSVSSGTYTLVGPVGQLLTASTGGGTRYYDGSARSTAAAVKVGARIFAAGTQDSLTHLSADTVTVIPAPGTGAGVPDGPFGGPAGHGPGYWGDGPAS